MCAVSDSAGADNFRNAVGVGANSRVLRIVPKTVVPDPECEAKADAGRLAKLKAALAAHPGKASVAVRVRIPGTAEVELELPEAVKLAASDAMIDMVESIFGRGSVRLA